MAKIRHRASAVRVFSQVLAVRLKQQSVSFAFIDVHPTPDTMGYLSIVKLKAA